MTNGELRKLALDLLRADSEDAVVEILRAASLWEDRSLWRLYGDKEGNFAQAGNQQSLPEAALVEKIINGIDAVLMSECFRAKIGPEGADAPKTMSQAVERFFTVRDGLLGNLDPKRQTELAKKLHVVAVGEKATPCYLIVDTGEGQTPDAFPDTFLSLNKSNKMRIPFVQGKFNSGGTGVLQFCGERNMQLILSRRDPDAPTRDGDSSGDLLLAAGATRDEILVDYPFLESEDITAVLEFAARQNDQPILRNT